jgi:hypothetical protein
VSAQAVWQRPSPIDAEVRRHRVELGEIWGKHASECQAHDQSVKEWRSEHGHVPPGYCPLCKKPWHLCRCT